MAISNQQLIISIILGYQLQGYQMQQEPFIVSEQQKQSFRENGYIKLENIIKPQDFEDFRKLMNKAVERISSQGDKQNRIDDYSSMFTQVTNLWKVQPNTASFILKERFANIAKQLLGVEHVRLYHDQALIKYPKAGKTVWHQDYFYWPIDSPNTVTMWLPLHNCPRQMGTMKFVKGSHLSSNIQKRKISQQSEQYFQQVIKDNHYQVQTYDLQAGDATFHYGRTLHCAHANGKQGKREVITIIYLESGAKVVQQQELNQFRKVDLSVFCPHVSPGQVINSQLNPIVS